MAINCTMPENLIIYMCTTLMFQISSLYVIAFQSYPHFFKIFQRWLHDTTFHSPGGLIRMIS